MGREGMGVDEKYRVKIKKRENEMGREVMGVDEKDRVKIKRGRMEWEGKGWEWMRRIESR